MYGYLLKNFIEIGVWNALPVKQVRRMQMLFPDVHLEIEFETELAPAASGKFKVIEKL